MPRVVDGSVKPLIRIYQFPVISLSVSPSSVNEDELTPLVFTFTRSGSLVSSLTVDYSIGGTGVNGVDYQTIGTSVVFGVGETTKTVNIIPINNNTVTENKTVTLTLISGTDYKIGTATGVTGTIINDDVVIIPVVNLSVEPDSVIENSGTSLLYTFSRVNSTASEITVNYSISGTAINGTDYQTIGTSVTLGVGEVSQTVNVIPIDNNIPNTNKTVILTLASGVGYTIGTATGVVGTIVNDDTPTYYCPQDITGFY